MSIQVINHYNIGESFPFDGQATFAEIGERCSLSESDTRRFLRLAIANRGFQESRKGIVERNALSKLLVQSP
jgi:hypothetical protein